VPEVKTLIIGLVLALALAMIGLLIYQIVPTATFPKRPQTATPAVVAWTPTLANVEAGSAQCPSVGYCTVDSRNGNVVFGKLVYQKREVAGLVYCEFVKEQPVKSCGPSSWTFDGIEGGVVRFKKATCSPTNGCNLQYSYTTIAGISGATWFTDSLLANSYIFRNYESFIAAPAGNDVVRYVFAGAGLMAETPRIGAVSAYTGFITTSYVRLPGRYEVREFWTDRQKCSSEYTYCCPGHYNPEEGKCDKWCHDCASNYRTRKSTSYHVYARIWQAVPGSPRAGQYTVFSVSISPNGRKGSWDVFFRAYDRYKFYKQKVHLYSSGNCYRTSCCYDFVYSDDKSCCSRRQEYVACNYYGYTNRFKDIAPLGKDPSMHVTIGTHNYSYPGTYDLTSNPISAVYPMGGHLFLNTSPDSGAGIQEYDDRIEDAFAGSNEREHANRYVIFQKGYLRSVGIDYNGVRLYHQYYTFRLYTYYPEGGYHIEYFYPLYNSHSSYYKFGSGTDLLSFGEWDPALRFKGVQFSYIPISVTKGWWLGSGWLNQPSALGGSIANMPGLVAGSSYSYRPSIETFSAFVFNARYSRWPVERGYRDGRLEYVGDYSTYLALRDLYVNGHKVWDLFSHRRTVEFSTKRFLLETVDSSLPEYIDAFIRPNEHLNILSPEEDYLHYYAGRPYDPNRFTLGYYAYDAYGKPLAWSQGFQTAFKVALVKLDDKGKPIVREVYDKNGTKRREELCQCALFSLGRDELKNLLSKLRYGQRWTWEDWNIMLVPGTDVIYDGYLCGIQTDNFNKAYLARLKCWTGVSPLVVLKASQNVIPHGVCYTRYFVSLKDGKAKYYSQSGDFRWFTCYEIKAWHYIKQPDGTYTATQTSFCPEGQQCGINWLATAGNPVDLYSQVFFSYLGPIVPSASYLTCYATSSGKASAPVLPEGASGDLIIPIIPGGMIGGS